jgi:hypothetical protein
MEESRPLSFSEVMWVVWLVWAWARATAWQSFTFVTFLPLPLMDSKQF